MRSREIEPIVQKYAKQYPIVTISGPRQSGKTTLSKMLFPKKKYASLENPDLREFARTDPNGFIQRYREGAIFDEVQRCPELVSYLQTEVDTDTTPGRFILTGSGQFELMENVSQSLAGRTAIVRLLPFSLLEAYPEQMPSLDQVLLTGFYPAIFDRELNPREMYGFYTDTYIEKDVRNLLNIKDLSRFEVFLKLCAGRSGQQLNLNEIGTAAGINHNTVKSWISILETSFIIKRVQPYYNNLNKRLVKAPKIYFLDTGLVCYLLGIKQTEHLEHHPLRGAIFETYVVSEIIKNRYNQGYKEDLYYMRDSKGHEIDLVLDHGLNCSLCDIKSAQTIASDFFKNLKYYEKTELQIDTKYLVYGGEDSYVHSATEVVSWNKLQEIKY
ncbi:MAG: ATP-binding protein [Spirochaetota bacterium]